MLLGALQRSEAILLTALVLFLLIGLFSALFVLHQHLKLKWFRNCGDDPQWIGQGFDAREVAPRLRAVRQDYLTELRSRPRSACHSWERITAARQLLARLPYFATIETTEEASSSPDTRHSSVP